MKIVQRGGAYLYDNCKITLIKAFVKHWASCVKLLPHWSHLKGFSLLWIIRWSNKFLLIIESNFQFLLMSIYTQGMKNLIPSLASLTRTEVSLTWSWGVYSLFDFVHCQQLCSWHCSRLAPLHLFLRYDSDWSKCFKMFIVLQPNLILNLHCLDLSWMFTRWCQIDIQYYKYVLSYEWKCFITLGALIWGFSGRNVLFGLNKHYLQYRVK